VKRHRATNQSQDLRGERAAERLATAITQKSARYVSR
jgi:hypothetical protein